MHKRMTAIKSTEVHATLDKWLVPDAMPLVYDLRRSHDSYLHDAKTGEDFLDFFCFFAARPIAFNHPKLQDKEFLERLLAAALHKPSNCDLYTVDYARFVHAFGTVVMGGQMPHLFFIEGGSPAVENAVKTAIDWKVRKNLQAGRPQQAAKILHFKQCFHGRTGYCLSLTDSYDPRKTQYFPKFDWPRVPNPYVTYPLDGPGLAATMEREKVSLTAIEAAFAADPHSIAGVIIEPIQGEGGDNYFRSEFLQTLRKLCDTHEALLIFDEVQTGFGGTGRWWDFMHHNLLPDVVVFGKKTQVCGLAASRRLDEVDSVFKIRSRISSTFSGNLVDMVRCERVIQIIEEDDLLQNATQMGAYLLAQLTDVTQAHAATTAPRGRGTWAAFDCPDTASRDKVLQACYAQKFLVLPCGTRTIRMRPPLDIDVASIDQGMQRLRTALRQVFHKA